MNSDEILGMMKKYGLKPATKREISLLTTSFFTLAYEQLLQKEVGFSYKLIVSFMEGDVLQFFLNEEYIADKTEELLEKGSSLVNRLLKRAKELFEKFLDEMKEAEKNINSSPEHFLEVFAESYLDCMLSLGIYNCFWRYTAVRGSSGKLSAELVEHAAKERDLIAHTYHKIERLIQKCADLIGDKYGFDSNLIKYMTLDEFKSFIRNKSLSTQKIDEISKRTKGYLYLRFEGKEYVLTDRKIIQDIKNAFIKKSVRTDIIKGKPAHPGVVKGYVYNLITKSKNKPKKDFILVTYMTKPDDIPLIKKCKAIVTDEGGVLCHAAIIARELKKPCVIGTKTATKVLKNNDYIEVDANNGVVKVLKRKNK